VADAQRKIVQTVNKARETTTKDGIRFRLAFLRRKNHQVKGSKEDFNWVVSLSWKIRGKPGFNDSVPSGLSWHIIEGKKLNVGHSGRIKKNSRAGSCGQKRNCFVWGSIKPKHTSLVTGKSNALNRGRLLRGGGI